MDPKNDEYDESTPAWDVALAALLQEEYEKHRRPLRLDDFERLAKEYAIRFDDIVDTVFKMSLHGQWRYTDASGVPQVLLQEDIDQLYVKGRLHRKDLDHLDGGWGAIP